MLNPATFRAPSMPPYWTVVSVISSVVKLAAPSCQRLYSQPLRCPEASVLSPMNIPRSCIADPFPIINVAVLVVDCDCDPRRIKHHISMFNRYCSSTCLGIVDYLLTKPTQSYSSRDCTRQYDRSYASNGVLCKENELRKDHQNSLLRIRGNSYRAGEGDVLSSSPQLSTMSQYTKEDHLEMSIDSVNSVTMYFEVHSWYRNPTRRIRFRSSLRREDEEMLRRRTFKLF